MNQLIRTIRRLAAREQLEMSEDEKLLDRFLAHRDEEAFAELVRRHAPMVMGAAMRVLRHPDDAEDVFQATFLTLARKGRSIRERGALPSWLHRVAFRLALRLKARRERKPLTEPLPDVPVEADPAAAAGWRELLPVLDREIQSLPAKYRGPLVLCCLEGKSYEEAAQQLGCPKGTVAVRLMRGREMLKKRLARRGLAAAALVVGGLTAGAAILRGTGYGSMAIQASRVAAVAAAVLAGAALTGVASASVISLIQAASHELLTEKVKPYVLLLVVAGLVGTGGSVGGQAGLGNIVAPSRPSAGAAGNRSYGMSPDLPRIQGASYPDGVVYEGPGMRLVLRPATMPPNKPRYSWIPSDQKAKGTPSAPRKPSGP